MVFYLFPILLLYSYKASIIHFCTQAPVINTGLLGFHRGAFVSCSLDPAMTHMMSLYRKTSVNHQSINLDG